jgi:hypothetical protein
MKRRRRRRGPRIATKVLEESLVERAKKLRDDPEILFPKCEGHEDHFFKNKIKLERVSRFEDNEKKLIALTKWGDPISKAFAVSLLVAHRNEVPRLMPIDVGGKNISIVYNRKVRKEVLVGVQNYDDPDLRLLAFGRIAKLKRLHLYSMRDGFVCTGREDKPPAKYVSEVLAAAKCNLSKKGECHICVHCEREGVPYLKITWIAPKVEVMLCQSCAKKENTYINLTKRFLSLDPKTSFRVEVYPNFKCECDDGSVLNEMTTPPREALARYMEGALDDVEFIDEHMEYVSDNVPSSAGMMLALGNKCYGDDTEAFIDALNPSRIERQALEYLLDDLNESIIVENATPNKILMMYWHIYGEDILESIVGDRDVAEKVFEKGQWKKDTPAKVLKTARSKAKKDQIESALPKYRDLPPVAAFADRIVRAYKAKGKKSALMEINKAQSSPDTKIKSVRYAFLLAFGAATGKEWQFTKEENDFGVFLSDYAQKLMEVEGDDYHDSLQELLKASGSTQKI